MREPLIFREHRVKPTYDRQDVEPYAIEEIAVFSKGDVAIFIKMLASASYISKALKNEIFEEEHQLMTSHEKRKIRLL